MTGSLCCLSTLLSALLAFFIISCDGFQADISVGFSARHWHQCRKLALCSKPRNSQGDETRRKLLQSVPIAAASMLAFPKRASADLIQFPCRNNLRNTYHLMRAGESQLEEQNIWGTNPLFLTNRENALSTTGIAQVEEACRRMEEAQLDLSIVKFPLAANVMDSANLVATRLHVGRNTMVPEYTYMDQRGIGNWDMQPLDTTELAVWAMDAKEAGTDGWGGVPPPNDDGTANEMLGHQVTRLRQLISLLESFASGDSILLIFPDGTSPALLSCLIAGIPLNRVHELNFKQGEVRMDVNYDSVRSILPSAPSKAYQEALVTGNEQLQILRSHNFISNKDQAYQAQLQNAKAQEAAWKAKTERRQAEAERKRQQHYHDDSARNVVAKEDGKADAKRAVFGSVLSVMGMLAVGSGGVTPAKETNEEKDAIAPSATNTANLGASTVPGEERRFQELEDMEALIENSPIIVPEFSNPPTRDIGDMLREKEEHRMQLAERAMEEYLNQDDGASEYLQFLGGLMDGDDE
eukprot:scaffold1530_cov98-Cylindrotheca_fusiformis.AAC.6